MAPNHEFRRDKTFQVELVIIELEKALHSKNDFIRHIIQEDLIMDIKTRSFVVKIVVVLTFLGMVAVNFLATSLPINGVTPDEVSDAYSNLFAPAGLTFSIWGLIYLLLLGFALFQFGLLDAKDNPADPALLVRTGVLFSISSLINMGWIFAWHYDQIGLSMILMALLLGSLIAINLLLRNKSLSLNAKILLKLPFSIYFGWITIATIANLTVLLVSLGWDGFGIPEQIWMILVLVAGLIIGTATMLKNHDTAYGLVIIWAYCGILLRHLSTDGFNGQYPEVYAVVIACLVLLVVAVANTRRFGKKDKIQKTDQSAK